jgi:hypothetical protein
MTGTIKIVNKTLFGVGSKSIKRHVDRLLDWMLLDMFLHFKIYSKIINRGKRICHSNYIKSFLKHFISPFEIQFKLSSIQQKTDRSFYYMNRHTLN